MLELQRLLSCRLLTRTANGIWTCCSPLQILTASAMMAGNCRPGSPITTQPRKLPGSFWLIMPAA